MFKFKNCIEGFVQIIDVASIFEEARSGFMLSALAELDSEERFFNASIARHFGGARATRVSVHMESARKNAGVIVKVANEEKWVPLDPLIDQVGALTEKAWVEAERILEWIDSIGRLTKERSALIQALEAEGWKPRLEDDDLKRRLALLREMGGDAKRKYNGEWAFPGIKRLVESERASGRRRASEKTIREDLRKAAQAELDEKRSGALLNQLE